MEIWLSAILDQQSLAFRGKNINYKDLLGGINAPKCYMARVVMDTRLIFGVSDVS